MKMNQRKKRRNLVKKLPLLKVKENLNIYMQAALGRNEALDHVLNAAPRAGGIRKLTDYAP